MTDFGQQGPFRSGDVLLEQFEILRLLGVGGHAYVYECRDQFLDELLAVKVIPNPPNRGRELLNRARAEAQLLRRLSHPNVVRMHTAAALRNDMVCLVMEKLDGVSLRHLLALLSRLSVVEALNIVRQVAVGVGAAHELDVVHRDIKPDNIFVLPPNNHVKVLDFGIAKFLGKGLQTSNKYKFQGTPLYMSPEHLRGAGVTVRSDIYQLGTVLFELLAGMNPNLIDLDNPGFEQVAMVQITRPTPSLARYAPNVPDYVDSLVQRATAKLPEQRFGSMDEFVQAIDATLSEDRKRDPDAGTRIRYVDAALVSAAKKLATMEAAFASTAAQPGAEDTPGLPQSSSPPTSRGQPEPALQREPSVQAVASYHPIAQPVGEARVPSQRAPLASRNSAPPPRPTPMTDSGGQKPSPDSPSLSFGLVLFAIAFGVFGGALALWFVLHRSPATADAPSPVHSQSAERLGDRLPAPSHASAVSPEPLRAPSDVGKVAGEPPGARPSAPPVSRSSTLTTSSPSPALTPTPAALAPTPALASTPSPALAASAPPAAAPETSPQEENDPKARTRRVSREQ